MWPLFFIACFGCFVLLAECLEMAEHWLKGIKEALKSVLFELAGMR